MFKGMAALAALLVALPAAAQMQVTPYNGVGPTTVSGSLVALNDTLTADLSGGRWATARFVVTTAGSGGITTQVTIDGTNWLPSAYAKRLDAVSANPSVVPWANNVPVAGVYEVPLPGNCIGFRILYATGGTATAISISGGQPYVQGVPVVATLYDVTEGSIGAGLAAYVQETSGWNSIMVMATSPTGQAVSVRQIDDAGAVTPTNAAAFTAATTGVATFTRYGGNTLNNAVAASAQALYANLARRMQWSLAAGGTVSTGRIRVEAAR